MSKKHRKQNQIRPSSASSKGLLRRIDQMIEAGDLEDAYELIYPFAQQNPSNVDALELLAEVAAELEEMSSLWYASTRLVRLVPDDPIHWHNAALTTLRSQGLFSGLYFVEEYIKRWPDDEQISEVHKLHEDLVKACEGVRASYPMAAAHSAEDLCLFEEARILTEMGNITAGREAAVLAVERIPDYPSPLNNLSLSYIVEGDLEEALRISRQTLERFPDNLHAAANTTQILSRLGRQDEARQSAELMCALPLVEQDDWAKRVEALSYLGDDAGVIETFQLVEKAKQTEQFSTARGYHLAAVAYARQGNNKRAKQLWGKALKIMPDLAIARANLEDSQLPAGERHGAWPFELSQWIPEGWIFEVLTGLTRLNPNKEAVSRNIQRALRTYPALKSAIPALLERGDPAGCEFALMIGMNIKHPAIREFVTGAHGSDELRMDAGNAAVDAGLLPRGKPVSMIIRGKPTDIALMSYEIHDRVSRSGLPRQAQKLMDTGYQAQLRGDHETGLRLCEEALKFAPENPTLLNHKAAALGMLGRASESKALIRHMAELHPDYFFARCAMAELCASEGNLDEAHTWLNPLLEIPSMHVSEFASLCKAHVEVLVARGKVDDARTWIGFLKDIDPDNPIIDYLEKKTRKFGFLGLLPRPE